MSYLALYRRFRPTDFTNVIGQDHVIKTLKNQILKDSVGHAYLFCGARGTGKTSVAKIFARAINCQSPVDGSPCGKCASCVSNLNQTDIDIIEMDAASNNKVEHIREIREKVQYPPVNGKYKVYIIDEVHMLTPEAFNALLKTLEEPPKHAVFILATTEQHKLPATILSRCMRFDFMLISTNEISKLISKIYDEIGKSYDKEAVTAIAKAGEGSVRDAISIADLCLSFSDGKLTYDDVLKVLGATNRDKIISLIKCVLASDVGGVLEVTDELSSLGKSMGVLVKDVISYIRDLILIKTCKTAKEILSIPDDKFSELKAVADDTSEARLLRVLEILSTVESNLKYSSSQRVVFETALVKASAPETDYDISSLTARIAELERVIKEGKIVSRQTVVEKVENRVAVENVKVKDEPVEVENTPVKAEAFEENIPLPFDDEKVEETEIIEEVKPVIKEEVKADNTSLNVNKIWGNVVRKLRNTPNMIVLWVACQEMQATIDGDNFIISVNSAGEKELLEKENNISKIDELISEYGNFKIVVKVKGFEENKLDAEIEDVKSFFGKDKTTII